MRILGITAPISENTAACLLEDGKLLSFCEEERFCGIKHAPRMIPKKAIEYCLRESNLSLEDVDYVAVGFENVFRAWIKNCFSNLKEGNFQRLWRENGAYLEYFVNSIRLKEYLLSLDNNFSVKNKLKFIPHHLAHAASAARMSGFNESIIISIDGVGENCAGLLGFYKNEKIQQIAKIPINQSLGWLYHIATHICGFRTHSHEGKVMGLAAYGKADLNLLRRIARLTEDGYILEKNWHKKLLKKYKRRKREEKISEAYKNLAASVQFFLEEAVIRIAKRLYQETGIKNICLAGGVALNCDMNARLLADGIFENIFIQPAANDSGTALGAAAEVYFQKTGKSCQPLKHVYFGPEYSSEEIESVLKESRLIYRKLSGLKDIAQKIKEGKIVGWFSGRMEFGPRALGGRSILANPSLPGIKERINREVKHREPWRPFAPSILKEHANDYFKNYHRSPFMLLTFKTQEEKIDKLQAAIHVDKTSRVHEVSSETNPRYYELISKFYDISGIPAVLNTSFNDNERPIVLTPQDALKTFYTTGIDVLVIGNFILEK